MPSALARRQYAFSLLTLLEFLHENVKKIKSAVVVKINIRFISILIII